MARYIEEKDVYALVEPTGVARVHCSQIDELPRADVVEVVRCKDCAHRVSLPRQYDYNGNPAMVCLMRSKPVKDNGYCDEGIRKTKKNGE